jgi:hypothetical protein
MVGPLLFAKNGHAMLKLFHQRKGFYMTKRVYEVEDIELQGYEKPVTIKPLTIFNFRRVAKILDNIQNPGKEYKNKIVVDILLEATSVAMETYDSDLVDVKKLEQHVDMATMEHILNVATGVKLNDPNQTAAM